MLELAYIDSELLPGIGAAVREKTGETALILPELLESAIKGIQTGVTLPELTKPAAVSDVLEGKEYIGAAGEKRTGTLVVCDTLADVEHFGIAGTGVFLELESTADGSVKTMTLPEENLKSENIKSGISIFHVAGSVKEIRTETGTITPAEDITAIDIDCTAGYRLFVFKLTSGAASGKAHWKDIYCTPGISAAVQGSRNANAHYIDANGKVQAGVLNATADTGLKFDVPGIFSAAGCTYTWTAYYWEDSV